MKALVWKEIRENLKWALLAMVVLGGALCHALYQTRYGGADYYYDNFEGITLCKKSLLLITTFGCPMIGLLLGLRQILPELKRDRWAALLHRPVSRATIFWGKVLAGLTLYVIATIPAFAFVVWRVATPGNFGVPFLPEMMRPGIADICAGAVYYFAALTLALHRGGWVGVKVFPLLAALHVSYFVIANNFFSVVVEAAAVMALVLLFAARGAMHHAESLEMRSWIDRLAFLAVIFYGACGLGDLGKSFLNAVGPKPRSEWSAYELSRDGFPLRLTYVNGVAVSATDVEGKILTDAKYRPDRVRNQIQYLNQVSSYIGDSHGWEPRKYPQPYRDSQTYLWAYSPYQFPRFERWVQLRKQRYFLCYLPVQKTVVGQLDVNGFSPLIKGPEPFPAEMKFDEVSSDRLFLWDSRGARMASLAQRNFTDFALPASAPIFGLNNAWVSTGQGSIVATGVALGTGMAVYDDKAALIAMLPYHYDVNRWGQLKLGINRTLDRFYLWYQPSAWIDAATRRTMSSFVEEVDVKGQVIRSYELPPLPGDKRSVSWSTFLDRRMQSPAIFFGEILYQKMGGILGSVRLKRAYENRFGNGWSVTKEIGLWSSGVSLVLALVTLGWARQAQFSWARTLAWGGFVLAFNVAGLITFRLAADWPCLVACWHCSRRRTIDREECGSCGKSWPLVPSTGTEIFDQPTASV